MKRCLAMLAAMTLLLTVLGQARAGLIQLSSSSQLDAGDTTALYTGNDGDPIAPPYALSAGGNTLTFTNSNGTDFQRVDEGASWTPGAFLNGTKLLWNLDNISNNPNGAVTISLATGVGELGLSVQPESNDNTTFTITPFSGLTSFGPFTVTVDNSTNLPNGNLGFIGFQGTAGDLITSLVISSSESNSSFNNDFVMGPVTFGTPAQGTEVPEIDPGSAISALSILALGTCMIQGRRRTQGKTSI